MAKRFDTRRILSLYSEDPDRQLTLRGMMKLLRLPGRDREALEELLGKLVAGGQLKKVKSRRYALITSKQTVEGRISIHRDGYGFVVVEDETPGQKDIFLPARQTRTAMDGDRVLVEVLRSFHDVLREGRLVRVVERAQDTVLGIFRDQGRSAVVIPQDVRLGQPLKVPWGEHLDAEDGELVVARIDTFATRGQLPLAHVQEVLGDPDDPRVEVLAQTRRFNLPYEFSEQVLQAAAEVLDTVEEGDLVGRRDLRGLPLVTIDGADAKDFDDAVHAVAEGSDTIRIRVAIADVAHYVEKGSELDRSARERGNSVYFPGICVPMLPEALSNGICSLNPGVDRLVMVAEMLLDQQGKRVESHFYPAVMHSHARLTYAQVQEHLEQKPAETEAIQSSLELMAEAALRLEKMRYQRGSLGLELAEAVVVLDQEGHAVDIVRGERLFAHKLIEELMLAANEAVAEFLTEHQLPMLYRVHDPPEPLALEPLRQVLRGMDDAPAVADKISSRDLQQLLERFRESAHHRIIAYVILRCLQQARYDTENSGHFGLASESYCHFTSPIRRYPDLTIHRVLKRRLVESEYSGDARLAEVGVHCSTTERRAMEAERDLVALKGCQVMQGHLGEMFSGRVSSVAAFGVFVELEEVFVEGLLPRGSIDDDRYDFVEQRLCLVGATSGREVHLGDRLRVKLVAVRPERREIEFAGEGFKMSLQESKTSRRKPFKRGRGRRG